MTAARGSSQHSNGRDLQVSPRKLFAFVERFEKLLWACVYSRVKDGLQMYLWSVKPVMAWDCSVLDADTSHLPSSPGTQSECQKRQLDKNWREFLKIRTEENSQGSVRPLPCKTPLSYPQSKWSLLGHGPRGSHRLQVCKRDMCGPACGSGERAWSQWMQVLCFEGLQVRWWGLQRCWACWV